MKLPTLLGDNPTFQQTIPLAKPLLPGFPDLAVEFETILRNGILSKGQHVASLEDRVAEALEVKHAVAVSSCTTGLMLTYQALDLTGDVIVPSFTFMATVSALRWAGLRPVFADVDLETTNLSRPAVRAAITPRTTAIVAVHNFGNPADIDGLQDIADQYGLRLIFDAAHGFGSLYKNHPVGRQGDAQVFSLSPTKLVVAGEGGIVATNDDDLASRIRVGREFGNCGGYDSEVPGLNGRLPELNSLLARRSLGNLEAAVAVRNSIAAFYRHELCRLPGIRLQEVRANDRSSYKDFAIIVDRDSFGLTRNELALTLKAENIETRAYYDPPVHQQRAYQQFAPVEPLFNTNALASGVLCLPIWSKMDLEIPSKICAAIAAAHQFADRIHATLSEQDLTVGEYALQA
ncbi:MAG TPA: DegT/DnrJ/EryC1/StrS family aminotransferase [Blastocatellia bacterium]|nr:DegT/DnrJ/EryC1/StrS family aminotransferase [Blastocatellia bacterium]